MTKSDALTPAAVAALSDEELNAACAERVMEWEYIAQGCGWYARKGDGYAYQCAVFSPATSIGDAAQGLDVLIGDGWVLELYVDAAGAMVKLRRMQVRSEGDIVRAKARRIERALTEACLLAKCAEAALLACGKEEG
jgi:hypothetical protein